jgi:hypothetical protein
MPELVRKTANAKLRDVTGRGPTALVTALFASATDGSWVGGTIVVTDTELTFSANALNRAVQKGTLDVAIPLDTIVGGAITGGFGTKIITVQLAGGGAFEFRCSGAKDVLATLENARR